MKNLFVFPAILLLFCTCHSPQRTNELVLKSHIPLIDSVVIESSGLQLWKDIFWTFNDSGGKNELYGLDFTTGKLSYTVQLSNVRNTDWEDVSQDQKHIYIAETGNNAGARHDLKIYRIKKKEITNDPVQSVTVDSILFRFADQTDFTSAFRKTKWDCEALFYDNDSLFVFTKDWVTFKTKVYGFPARIGDYSVLPIDSFDAKGLITGADILPNGKFALIGYKDFHSFAWIFDRKKKSFFDHPRFIDLCILENAQTEGICFSKKGDIYISCEQTENYPQQIWKIPKKNL